MPSGRDTKILVSLKSFIELTNKAQGAVERGFKSMGRHAKSIERTFENLFETVRVGTDRLRLLALIGMGTLAMLFMNTPIMQAGFEMIKAALTMLFITMQDYVLPVLATFADYIKQINDYLMAHEGLRKFVGILTAAGVGFAVLSALLVPLLLVLKVTVSALRGFGAVLRFVGRGILSAVRFLRPFARLVGRLSLPITLLIGALSNWREVLGDLKIMFQGAITVAEGFKRVISGIIHLNFRMIGEGLGLIFKGLTMQFKGFLSVFIDSIEGVLSGFDDILSLVGIRWGLAGRWERLFNRVGLGTTYVGDAIITPGGQIVRTSPGDWLIATKNPSGLAAATNITISFEGASIYLSDGFDLDDLADGLATLINRKLGLTK